MKLQEPDMTKQLDSNVPVSISISVSSVTMDFVVFDGVPLLLLSHFSRIQLCATP